MKYRAVPTKASDDATGSFEAGIAPQATLPPEMGVTLSEVFLFS